MSQPAVETIGLRKAYGPTTVLAGVDLTVTRGSVFALLGPNGAGKTTTVRILATLQPPDGGTARVAGRDVVGEPDAVRRAISLTGQFAAVDDQLTAEENLLLIGRLRRLGRAERRRRAAELLDMLDLTADARRRVKTFSGGMRRKVDLAMSLVGRPEVLFLDEPTTGLDPRSRQAVWDVVGELVGSGVTIFLTTQYLEEADQLADRISVLDGGRVVATGSADELKRR
ncbi:MAG TPA: ATP-binding cassette domain-containing protein, partial [Mycobacteriales bacterium]